MPHVGYNPSAYAHASLNNLFGNLQQPWGDLTDPNIVTIPGAPGLQSGILAPPPPNADDMQRSVVQSPSGPVIESKTSNLITCPNADGDVSLGCWLFSSDNDRFARKNLEQDTMPGEAEPNDIKVVPGNWLELAGSTASPGNYSTVTPELYNTETLASEQRIFTGIMMNSNTGQLYETYEDDVPPPNTDRKRLLPEQMSNQNPKVTALSGGWDPSMPTRHKVEVLEVEYGADAGRNPWGPQLYASAIRDLAEQKDVRQQFNNRNGFVPVEPAWDRRAVGFVGHVSAYRGTPHMPPTQREARPIPDTFSDTVRNIDFPGMDVPAPPDMMIGGSFGSREDPRQNRGAPAVLSGGSFAAVNHAPGRLEWRPPGSLPASSAVGHSGQRVGQIYDDGEIRLRPERPWSEYSQAPDNHVVQTVVRVPTVPRVQRSTDQDPSRGRYHAADTLVGDGDQQGLRMEDVVERRVIRGDQDPSRGRYHAADTLVGDGDQQGLRMEDVVERRVVRGDQDAGRQHTSTGTALIGAQDGRMADEQAFLASFKLVDDRSWEKAGARAHTPCGGTVHAKGQVGGLSATRLGTELANSVRAQGFVTAEESVYGERVAEWTRAIKDTAVRDYHGGTNTGGEHRSERMFRNSESIRGSQDTYGNWTRGGEPNAASTLAHRDVYRLSEKDLYSIVGTRNPIRGLEQVA